MVRPTNIPLPEDLIDAICAAQPTEYKKQAFFALLLRLGLKSFLAGEKL